MNVFSTKVQSLGVLEILYRYLILLELVLVFSIYDRSQRTVSVWCCLRGH